MIRILGIDYKRLLRSRDGHERTQADQEERTPTEMLFSSQLRCRFSQPVLLFSYSTLRVRITNCEDILVQPDSEVGDLVSKETICAASVESETLK